MKTFIMSVLVIGIIAGAGYAYTHGFQWRSAELVESVVESATTTATDSATHGKLPGHEYVWEFKDLGTNAVGVPRTAVTLKVDGVARTVGEYEGSCTTIDGSSWQYVKGEHSGAICYFAGGGTEIGVFEENNAMVVKEGVIDEGSAEVAPVRGGYKTLFAL